MEPTQLISLEKARELNKNYNDTRAALHQQKLGKEDANAVWYSLQELENYIAYIKKQGVEKGYDVDGIRLYMGVYPSTDEASKAGYTTLFLAEKRNLQRPVVDFPGHFCKLFYTQRLLYESGTACAYKQLCCWGDHHGNFKFFVFA